MTADDAIKKAGDPHFRAQAVNMLVFVVLALK